MVLLTPGGWRSAPEPPPARIEELPRAVGGGKGAREATV
jgi:hypothetical protein